MNLLPFVQVQYCYDYLVNQIPVALLMYSHIPTALVALIFGGFLYVKTRNLASGTLLVVSLFFGLWCLVDLASWFSFFGSDLTMFSWSLADFFGLVFFLFAYYFLYVFSTERDLPVWQKLFGLALLLPTAIWTYFGSNLSGYDSNTCEALENSSVTSYMFYAEGIILMAVVVFCILQFRKLKNKQKRMKVLLAGVGVSIFLGFFLASTLLASYLTSSPTLSDYAYNFEIYGLFGMPILLIYLGYLIVRYRAFDVRIFGAQALVISLVVIIGSEFAFVTTVTARVLVTLTLLLTAFVGLILIKSVKREIEQRERIEKLAGELGSANAQQVILIHFITHQIKGFVAKSRNIFSLMVDGDYGVLPEQAKVAAQTGFDSDTKGAQTIQEILNAANIKSGKVTYAKEAFDLTGLIAEIVKDLKPLADAKGLSLTTALTAATFTGDKGQLVNAFRNLIDNSIKYTPKGSVDVSLHQEGAKIHFEIKDTGVGISAEDMKNLFTEGGRGQNSQKINVESTGFGLYIVKNIIEAHKGTVRAESEGEGKGSRFIVELPV